MVRLRDLRSNKKGSSLLEVLLATILFSIFTMSIWGLFQKVYWAYWKTDQEVKLLEEGRMIVEFIQEEIRMAEAVVIQVRGVSDVMESEKAIHQELLQSIAFIKDKDNLSKPNNEDKLQLFAAGGDEGYYLRYQKNIVAEDIKEITVSREPGKDLVEITCTMASEREGETLPTTIVISLEHKKLKRE